MTPLEKRNLVILAKRRKEGLTYRAIGKLFGLSGETVGQIIRNFEWKERCERQDREWEQAVAATRTHIVTHGAFLSDDMPTPGLPSRHARRLFDAGFRTVGDLRKADLTQIFAGPGGRKHVVSQLNKLLALPPAPAHRLPRDLYPK